jgi:hypothetical protein
MFSGSQIFSQNSFGFMGYQSYPDKLSTPTFSLESNPSYLSDLEDWGLSFSYGAEFPGKVNTNIYSIALAKTIGSHSITGRYTPGYQKEFFFSTGETISTNDTTIQSLKVNFNYKELFGLGYSYKISEDFSAGLSLRFFSQEFEKETVTPVIGNPILQIETLSESINFWKSDIGFAYNAGDYFTLRLESINLLNFGEKTENSEFSDFELKRDKGAQVGFNFHPSGFLNLNAVYETSNSFQAGVSGSFQNFYYCITTFHDKYQKPFIAGMVPSLAYKFDLFEVMLSGVKYFSTRNKQESYDEFASKGIHNIINNNYSFDKLFLSVSFTLNTIQKLKVKITNVEITKDVFPTISENYLVNPFAYIHALNTSDASVEVTPSVKIDGILDDPVKSQSVTVLPGDSAKIPVYIMIPESYSSEKPDLSYATFYLTTDVQKADDQIQKPVLINGINAWDGEVSNLKYFVHKDPDFSVGYSRTLLGRYKAQLDTIAYALSSFYKAKLLFDDFAKRIVYTSDPRATAEHVQFPKQTIDLKGGDCDDLSVCFSSLLGSVGIQSAFIDYKPDSGIRHVQIMFNTNLNPEQARLITNNDQKYFIRKNSEGKDEVWLPVETTDLTNFSSAWNTGVEKFRDDAIENLGLATGKVAIIDIN